MSTRSDHRKFSSVKISVAAVDLGRGLRFIIQCCFCYCLLRKLFSHIYVYLVCITSVLECFCHRCVEPYLQSPVQARYLSFGKLS
jgi:hypothetical protein